MTKKIVLKTAICLLAGLLCVQMQGEKQEQNIQIVPNPVEDIKKVFCCIYNIFYGDYNRSLECKKFVCNEGELMVARIIAKRQELAEKFATNQSTAHASWNTYKSFLEKETLMLIKKVKEKYPDCDNGSYTKQVIEDTGKTLNNCIANKLKQKDGFIDYLERQKAWYRHMPTIGSYICGFLGGFLNTIIKKSQLSETLPQETGNYLTGATAIFLGTQAWNRNPTSPTTHCFEVAQASVTGHILGWLCAKGLYKVLDPVRCSK